MSGKILLCRTCEEPMTVQATADFTAILMGQPHWCSNGNCEDYGYLTMVGIVVEDGKKVDHVIADEPTKKEKIHEQKKDKKESSQREAGSDNEDDASRSKK